MVGLTPIVPIAPGNQRRVQGVMTILVKLNGLYRQWAWLLTRLHCLRDCIGVTASKSGTAIDLQMNIVRGAEPYANQTSVLNDGTSAVMIYESEVLIGLVQPGEIFVLDMPGRGRIWAQSLSGNQPIVITTSRTCNCGVTYDSDAYDNPVGAFLL
jgi:hypothetical protein